MNENKLMIRIAVVGDIGSGKSHVAKLFGYPIFNADYEVNKIYKKNRKCYKKLKNVLHNYITSFPIKKKDLSKAVLDNSYNIKKISNIVHPHVRIRLNNFLKKNKKKKYVVLDIPLLIENKLNFVDANKKEINKRLKRRYTFSFKIAKKLKKFQLPVEVKKKKSNFIIKNKFNINSTEKDVKIVKEKILLNA